MLINFADMLSEVRSKKPLIHHITNYVTANDCANIVLALGASPVMADDCGEVSDIVSVSSALVLNIGTLNKRTVESMLVAGKAANSASVPVILDPVGVGVSKLRSDSVSEILNNVKISVLRGNMSEIRFL
ncbi:MAG: hydroxyethylthiazole kinase, partial [Bacillota bacterium]|nr:hydroxyethylthiazole kinase [Bacillota bacterium]